MSFFEGASNIKIGGGEFNNIKGNLKVYDRSRHETSADSGNAHNNNVFVTENYDPRVHGEPEDDPMQSISPTSEDDRGNKDRAQRPPPPTQFKQPPISNAGGGNVINTDSFNVKNNQVKDVFNNYSQNRYEGRRPPTDERRRRRPQGKPNHGSEEEEDEGPQLNRTLPRGGQGKGPVQTPLQTGFPQNMRSGMPPGPHIPVNNPNIQHMSPQMSRDFSNLMKSALSDLPESNAPKTDERFRSHDASPSSSYKNRTKDAMSEGMASLSIDDPMSPSPPSSYPQTTTNFSAYPTSSRVQSNQNTPQLNYPVSPSNPPKSSPYSNPNYYPFAPHNPTAPNFPPHPPFPRVKSDPQRPFQQQNTPQTNYPMGSSIAPNLSPFNQQGYYHSHSNPSLAPHMKEPAMTNYLSQSVPQGGAYGNNHPKNPWPGSSPTSGFSFPPSPTSTGGPVFRNIEGDIVEHDHIVHRTNISLDRPQYDVRGHQKNTSVNLKDDATMKNAYKPEYSREENKGPKKQSVSAKTETNTLESQYASYNRSSNDLSEEENMSPWSIRRGVYYKKPGNNMPQYTSNNNAIANSSLEKNSVSDPIFEKRAHRSGQNNSRAGTSPGKQWFSLGGSMSIQRESQAHKGIVTTQVLFVAEGALKHVSDSERKDAIRAAFLDLKIVESQYAVLVGYNEALIQSGFGYMEEVHVFCCVDISHSSQLLMKLGKVLTPYPGIIFTPSSGYKTPVLKDDGTIWDYDDLSLHRAERYSDIRTKGILHSELNTSSLAGSQRSASFTRLGNSERGGNDDPGEDKGHSHTDDRKDDGDGENKNDPDDINPEDDPDDPEDGGGGDSSTPDISFEAEARLFQGTSHSPPSKHFQVLGIKGKLTVQTIPAQLKPERLSKSRVEFIKLKFQSTESTGLAYEQVHVRVEIDTKDKYTDVNVIQPLKTPANSRDTKETVVNKTTTSGALGATVGFMTPKAELSISGNRSNEASSSTESTKYRSRITEWDSNGIVSWGFSVDDLYERQNGIEFGMYPALPSANFEFRRQPGTVGPPPPPPEHFDVLVSSCWSLISPGSESHITASWFSWFKGLDPGTAASKVPLYSNLCQLVILEVPSDLLQLEERFHMSVSEVTQSSSKTVVEGRGLHKVPPAVLFLGGQPIKSGDSFCRISPSLRH